MAGGRPRSLVWMHFNGRGDVECKRCKQEIVKAKVQKLERHIFKNCPLWSARERSDYITASKTRQRGRAIVNSAESSAGANESSRDSASMTQEDLNELVTAYIRSSGAPLRTVEHPAFKTLVLEGRSAGLKVPSLSLIGGRLLEEAEGGGGESPDRAS